MDICDAEYLKIGKWRQRQVEPTEGKTQPFIDALTMSSPAPDPIMIIPSRLHVFRVVGRTTYFAENEGVSFKSVLSGVTNRMEADYLNHHIDASRYMLSVCRSLIRDREKLSARIAWVMDGHLTIVGAAVGHRNDLRKFQSLQWDKSQWSTFPIDVDADTVAERIADKVPTLPAT